MSNSKNSSIEQDLWKILNNELAGSDARDLLRSIQAPASDDVTSLLKEVAELPSDRENHKVVLEAVDGLSRLGETREYFIEKARAHLSNKWVAYYSMLVLARDLSDENAFEVFEEIKQQTKDNQIRGAVARAQRLRLLTAEYADLGSDEEKCSFLLEHFRGDWDPITLGERVGGSAINPQAVWSQRELSSLSESSPEAIARAISELDLTESFGEEKLIKSYKNYLARFLSKAARQELQRLARETPTGNGHSE